MKGEKYAESIERYRIYRQRKHSVNYKIRYFLVRSANVVLYANKFVTPTTPLIFSKA